VSQTSSGPNGFNEGDTFYTDYLNAGLCEGYHLLVNNAKYSHAPQIEGRNVHTMSGQVLRHAERA
jgi:hypothetical protein